MERSYMSNIEVANVLQRLGLMNGRIYAHYWVKNVQWFLMTKKDGRITFEFLGSGDMKKEDIYKVAENLRPNEVFAGYREYWVLNQDPWEIVPTPEDALVIVRRHKTMKMIKKG